MVLSEPRRSTPAPRGSCRAGERARRPQGAARAPLPHAPPTPVGAVADAPPIQSPSLRPSPAARSARRASNAHALDSEDDAPRAHSSHHDECARQAASSESKRRAIETRRGPARRCAFWRSDGALTGSSTCRLADAARRHAIRLRYAPYACPVRGEVGRARLGPRVHAHRLRRLGRRMS